VHYCAELVMCIVVGSHCDSLLWEVCAVFYLLRRTVPYTIALLCISARCQRSALSVHPSGEVSICIV
jgi:hypothetical protein